MVSNVVVSSSKKNGKVRPIKNLLIGAMSHLRRQNSKATMNSNQIPKFVLGATEMVRLGQLTHHWEEIVGADLSSHIWPARFFKAKLTLVVRTHQWLNTLTFCKEAIKTNITKYLPGIEVVKIMGRVGEIPAISKLSLLNESVTWPDWKLEADIDLPMLTDEELLEGIQRCRKKLKARVKGLLQSGYFLCPKCSSNMVSEGNKNCAVCLYRKRISELSSVRKMISNEPWITYFDVNKIDKKLTSLEFDAMKSSLLEDSMMFIDQLAQQQPNPIDKELDAEMRVEMVRAIALVTGVTADKIDFDELDEKFILCDSWYKYLRIKKTIIKPQGDVTC